MTETNPKLILASRSPRRRQLLQDAGYDPIIADIDADESFPEHLTGGEVARYLAEHKARQFGGILYDAILVTADTIVYLDQQVINKPADKHEAIEMLLKLSGREHIVYTGVNLLSLRGSHSFFEETRVSFYPISKKEAMYYVTHYRPLDKAGAYGVQDWLGLRKVKRIEGCFYNVMGFPVSRFSAELDSFTKNF